ncbi:hypothetical protein SAPIO_CDS0140 [Scedosporium apiospermum]|uniref:Uncharacterized protein n=1 Tax=Pseudallescheria apiosperma TaxID=563466 RepID=A0A084GHL7_PSEDA|nr:uncharacterized protein SAPIO_CDS0140 [Scedosporium apiospermum]KEZ46829.1 hypothetical protein SAPIO_CDS0140 [Scedosporium apiospermum]
MSDQKVQESAVPASQEPGKSVESTTEEKFAEAQQTVATASTSGPDTEEKKDATLADAKAGNDANAPTGESEDAAPAEPEKAEEETGEVAAEKAEAAVNGEAAQPAEKAIDTKEAEVGGKGEAPTEAPATGGDTAKKAEETPATAPPTEEAVEPTEPKPATGNGEAAPVSETEKAPIPEAEASEPKAGEKRQAEAAEVANGGEAGEPAGKKVKTSDDTPTTNGGAAKKKTSKGKKEKFAAPVGRTARRTRSQGLADA